MFRHTLAPAVLVSVFLVALPSRASAQGYPVFDPASFIELVQIVKEAQRIYQAYYELREMWDRFRRALPAGAKGRYVLPNMRWRTEGVEHDPFGLYSPIIEDAVNIGDADGEAWQAITTRLPQYPDDVLASFSPEQRRHASQAYTNALMMDGFGSLVLGGLGEGRMAGRAMEKALEPLQEDYLSDGTAQNGNIALLQKAVGARLVTLRGEQITNQFLSYLVEAQLIRQKATRDGIADNLAADIARTRYTQDLDLITAGDGARTVYRLP
ncbi:MAG: hypothetical protein GEU99_23440 [Luteitalea sp.]|nr:hypothetical protein [Luteitalea sp.]